jgi:hypothetical protein
MKYTVEMTSGGRIYIQSFMKIVFIFIQVILRLLTRQTERL